ncbi:MAG: SIS domain-containing protein [Acidimicrobiia bacterium]|nr:SIS domain-containing protein [Acidimicrobiia bacterium]
MPERSAVLVAAATEIAAVFDHGGRLLVTGEGRAAADACHVAVEFLHPVITGKRALPAAVGAERAGPGDVVLAIGYGGAHVSGRAEVAIADHAVPGARHVIELPGDDAFAAKEAALASYHVLWELVHVFLDDAVSDGGAAGELDALYPMLYRQQGADMSAAIDAAIASTDEKLAETAVLRAESLAANDEQLSLAAHFLADAPTVFTFGNGGSATDAADLAWALGTKGWALGDDVATVTALANDVSFDVVFARQLATLARPGDVAVGLSTSGTSANVLAGLREARRLDMATIGLAGYDGGTMATAELDVCCVVHSTSVHRIQESYVTLYDEMLRRAGVPAR